jgi:hypothetical protein
MRAGLGKASAKPFDRKEGDIELKAQVLRTPVAVLVLVLVQSSPAQQTRTVDTSRSMDIHIELGGVLKGEK